LNFFLKINKLIFTNERTIGPAAGAVIGGGASGQCRGRVAAHFVLAGAFLLKNYFEM
jgi:hypothetical protein